MKKMYNSLIHWIKQHSIISALLVTFLGSALWEWIISPLATILFDRIMSLSGKLFTAISNNIYCEISNGYYEHSSNLLLSMFFAIFISSLLSICIEATKMYSTDLNALKMVTAHYADIESSPKDKDSVQILVYQDDFYIAADDPQQLYDSAKDPDSIKELAKDHFSQSKKFLGISLIIFVPCAIALFWILIQTNYVNDTITTLTNNIEIVSPYISDLEYKQLKSSFHLMDSREDYNLLCASLKEIADQNHLRLK